MDYFCMTVEKYRIVVYDGGIHIQDLILFGTKFGGFPYLIVFRKSTKLALFHVVSLLFVEYFCSITGINGDYLFLQLGL